MTLRAAKADRTSVVWKLTQKNAEDKVDKTVLEQYTDIKTLLLIVFDQYF